MWGIPEPAFPCRVGSSPWDIAAIRVSHFHAATLGRMAPHLGDPRKTLQFSGRFPPSETGEEPFLVLAIDQREVQLQLLFQEDRSWYDIEWQGGGVECWVHLPLTCTILEPRPEIRPALVALNDKWVCSSLGSRWQPSLDQVLEYRSDLSALGLDCESTYRDVAEATYPIDLGPAVLEHLSA